MNCKTIIYEGVEYVDDLEEECIEMEIPQTKEEKKEKEINNNINSNSTVPQTSFSEKENLVENEIKKDPFDFYSEAFVKKVYPKSEEAKSGFQYVAPRQKELQEACDDFKNRYNIDCLRLNTKKGIDKAGKTAVCKWGRDNRDPYFNKFIKENGNGGGARNIGAITGPYLLNESTEGFYLLVIDIDDTESGNILLKICKANDVEIPISLTQKTGSGNTQIFFKLPYSLINDDPLKEWSNVKNKTKAIKVAGKELDIDIRADGGYAAIPPSVNFTEEGGTYTWINYGEEIAQIPDKLLDIFNQVEFDENYKPIEKTKYIEIAVKENDKKETTKKEELRRTYDNHPELEDYLYDLLDAIGEEDSDEFKSHDKWLENMLIIRNYYGDENSNLSIVKADSLCEQYSGSDYNPAEIEKKFEKDFQGKKIDRKEKGITTLEKKLDKLNSDKLKELKKKYKININSGKIDYNNLDKSTMRILNGNDLKYAKMFVKAVGDNFKHINSDLTFLWDDDKKLWLDCELELRLKIAEVFEEIIEKEIEKYKDEKIVKLLKDKLNYITGSYGCAGITKYVIPLIRDRDFEYKLDSPEPYILPISNGKNINLITLEVFDRTIKDIFTFECPVAIDYDEKKLKIVDDFMLNICSGDIELKNYFQKVLGYFITGETKERAFFIWWGSGRNGKSTICDLMGKIMNNYRKEIDKGALIDNGSKPNANSHSSHLQPLIKSRMVSLSEAVGYIDEDSKIDAAQIKRITGRDTISIRPLYKDPIQVKSVSKLLLHTNIEPKIDVNDEAILDRLILMPFLQKFGNNKGEIKSDPDLVYRLETELLNSVFTWVAIGAKRWYEEGLKNKPKSVIASIKKYVDKDSFNDFVENNITKTEDKKNKIKRSELYSKYVYYCENEICIDKKEIKRKKEFFDLTDKRFGKPKINDGYYLYQNIKWKVNSETSSEISSENEFA